MSSLPRHSRSEKQVPPRELEAWHSGENHQSLCSTAVNSCIAMFRGHSSMKVVASLLFYFVSIFLGFSLCSSCFLPPAVPEHTELYGNIAQTELLCSIAESRSRSPGPPSRVENRRMEIALGTSSFAVWIEKLMIAFRDCKDHMDYMSQVDKGAVLHKCLPTLPSRSVQLRG